jgi:hypothetical protein
MNQILAKRYAFCDFSSIAGFPNQVPTRDEWENSIPKFRGEEWEVPAEHLLDFHESIDRLEIVHEDVQIKLFKFSLEGIALDWCRSLPDASVCSLADFHAAFHVFCKDHFSDDLLYPECCHDFNLLNKKSDSYVKYATAGDASHHDQDIDDLQDDGHSIDVLNSAPNTYSFRSAEIEEDSLQFPDLQGLSNLQLEQVNHDPKCIDVAAAYVMSSPYFPDLQKKVDHSTYEKSDGGDDLKGPDHQSVSCVSPTDFEQPAFNSEISKGNLQHYLNFQLEQQSQKVLPYEFDDPFVNYLDSMSSINPRIFLSKGDCFYHPLKSFFCMIWSLLLFGLRFSMIAVNQFLTWLHWKFDLT